MSGIVNGYPEKDISGELTFVGVLNKYYNTEDEFPSISARWKAKTTRQQYENDYKNRIIPKLDYYRALKDYEDSDFKKLLESIRKEYLYSEERMSHYRLLIWQVYKAGVDRGLYKDKLMWDIFGVSEAEKEMDADEIRKRILTTRKSFSNDESKKILEWYKKQSPEKIDGEALGFILMLFFPLRNQEVCALNYNDISIMTSYKIPCIKIYKSTMINSSTVKSGGKTINAIRIIPIFDFLYDFIIKRKEFIKFKINEGKINCDDVGNLPVVCRKDFSKRCSSGDISSFAKSLFKSLDINSDTLKGIGRDFYNNAEIEEKEPTAYLLRRNCCTRLACIDLTDNQLQYMMGHLIEDDSKTRNYYVNDDELNLIYKKLKKHPYYKFITEYNSNQKAIIIGEEYYRDEFCTEKNMELEFANVTKRNITLCLNEISDKVKIYVGKNMKCEFKTKRIVTKNRYKDSVDVSELKYFK